MSGTLIPEMYSILLAKFSLLVHVGKTALIQKKTKPQFDFWSSYKSGRGTQQGDAVNRASYQGMTPGFEQQPAVPYLDNHMQP